MLGIDTENKGHLQQHKVPPVAMDCHSQCVLQNQPINMLNASEILIALAGTYSLLNTSRFVPHLQNHE